MEGNANVPENHSKRFIERCKDAFKWTDLSRDVIMDVGCGEELNCGKALLEEFSDVGAIIFMDKNPNVSSNFQLLRKKLTEAKMEFVPADIEKRETLRNYEGKMNKVISCYTFHEVEEKEEALQNVYHLLKPGGEAAVLFVRKVVIYDWLMEMIKKPKWNALYKKQFSKDVFKNAIGEDEWKKMAEKIGFRVVDCKEADREAPHKSDQFCKDWLYHISAPSFNIPSALIEEFKEDSFQVFLKVSPRDGEKKTCYRTTELSLLVTKPAEGSSSKTK